MREGVAGLALKRPTIPSAPVALVALASISLATLVIAGLEQVTDIPDASAVYLVAVVIVAIIGGTAPAVATAFAFLIYDLLFTDPRLSLAISDPAELLNLVLVLIVALAVGQLAGLGRQRAAEAERRAAEATSLFAISRLLATAETTAAVASPIVELLGREADLERVWIGLDVGGREQILADTGVGPVPTAPIVTTLVRMPGDVPARWVRTHEARDRTPSADRSIAEGDVLRARIEAGGMVLGSLWALRPPHSPTLGHEATRLLALAADQVALGLRRDRLRQDATSAEVARRGDALKSALLDSVSHDLRTPLASIRATAGNLADPDVRMSPEQVREAAETIDGEAQRLDRFVRSVLDLSRIESGTLRPDLEVFEALPLIERAVGRLEPVLRDRPVTYDVKAPAALIQVDEVLFDAIVSNIIENVADHTPPGTPIRIWIAAMEGGRIRIVIEDGGPGVAAGDIDHIFGKFQRVGPRNERARRGMGIGLSIVRGMTEALGGRVTARASDLGGLAIELDLPVAATPSEADGP